MEVTVNVNIELSKATREFLTGLFCSNYACVCDNKPAVEQKVEKPQAKQAPKPVAQPQLLLEEPKPVAQPQLPLEEPEAEKPKAAELKVPAKKAESSSLTIEDVRKALAEKVNDHRATIKEKLNEFGAASVTKLEPSKYQEMYDFLKSL